MQDIVAFIVVDNNLKQFCQQVLLTPSGALL